MRGIKEIPRTGERESSSFSLARPRLHVNQNNSPIVTQFAFLGIMAPIFLYLPETACTQTFQSYQVNLC